MSLEVTSLSPSSSFISVMSWMNFVSGSVFPPNGSSSITHRCHVVAIDVILIEGAIPVVVIGVDRAIVDIVVGSGLTRIAHAEEEGPGCTEGSAPTALVVPFQSTPSHEGSTSSSRSGTGVTPVTVLSQRFFSIRSVHSRHPTHPLRSWHRPRPHGRTCIRQH